MVCFPRGIPLYISEDFYMGPASLKTSPPLGVALVRKRVEALGKENIKRKK
jgi:hypothetical protein